MKLLQLSEELPASVKTLIRAQILIQLKRIQPSNRVHLISLGYSRGTVSKILREFVEDGVVLERFHLYRLTDFGDTILKKIQEDPLVRHWLSTKNWRDKTINLDRPNVMKLD